MMIQGDGSIVTAEREVGDFERVRTLSSGRVRIHQGDRDYLTVTADSNLLGYVETETRDGVLRISGKSGSYCFTRCVVDVYMDIGRLRGATVSSSGSVELADTFQGESLEVNISGSGSFAGSVAGVEDLEVAISGSGSCRLAGRGENLRLGISGSGEFRGDNLEVETAAVSVSGSGDARVRPARSLEASVSGSGEVRYQGAPQVSTRVSGSGTVRRV